MFCSKCGNQLKDGDRFCAKCGASVLQQTEPQEKPAAEPVYSQVPVEGRAEVQTLEHRVAAPVQKKSKKGLIIGLSLGGVLLVLVTVVIMFASGLFNSASSSPFPVLKVEQTQIYYGEDLDQLEEAFPNI